MDPNSIINVLSVVAPWMTAFIVAGPTHWSALPSGMCQGKSVTSFKEVTANDNSPVQNSLL